MPRRDAASYALAMLKGLDTPRTSPESGAKRERLGGRLALAACLLSGALLACSSSPTAHIHSSDTADAASLDAADSATAHPLRRKPDGSACPDGSMWNASSLACSPIGPPECAAGLFDTPEKCQPRWCAEWRNLDALPCQPGSFGCNLVGRTCTAEELASGQGCAPGLWPDPQKGGTCVPAGWLGQAPLQDASVVPEMLAQEMPRWCWDWMGDDAKPCDPADWRCRPLGRDCTATERLAGAGCPAGWWPHPAFGRSCMPAGYLGAEDAAVTVDADGDPVQPAPAAPYWCEDAAGPRPCTHAEVLAAKGCRAGWWRDPVRKACAPAGWLDALTLPDPATAAALPPLAADETPHVCADWADASAKACAPDSPGCFAATRLCTMEELAKCPFAAASTSCAVAGASAACPKGFAAGADAACVPDPAACAAAAPVGASWLFVDAVAAPGGVGSAAKPYASLAVALAAAPANAHLYLAAGTYALPTVLDKPVSMTGTCAAQVQLKATQPLAIAADVTFIGVDLLHTALQVQATLQLKQARLGGSGLVHAGPGAKFLAQDSVLQLPSGTTLGLDGATATWNHVVLQLAAQSGGWAQNAAVFEASELRVLADPQAGAALRLESGTLANVRAMTCAPCGQSALTIIGPATAATVAGLLVEGGSQAVLLKSGAKLKLSQSRIDKMSGSAIALTDATLDAEHLEVDHLGGPGIEVAGSSQLHLRRSRLSDVADSGISAQGSAQITLRGVSIERVHALQQPAVALRVDGATLVAEGVQLRSPDGFGLYASQGAQVQATGLLVADALLTDPDKGGRLVRIHASNAHLAAVHLQHAVHDGIELAEGATVTVDTALLTAINAQASTGWAIRLSHSQSWLQNVRVSQVGDKGLAAHSDFRTTTVATGIGLDNVPQGVWFFLPKTWRVDGSVIAASTGFLMNTAQLGFGDPWQSEGSAHGLACLGDPDSLIGSAGISIHDGAHATLHALLIRRAGYIGLDVDHNAAQMLAIHHPCAVDAEDVLITDTRPGPDFKGGYGVHLGDHAELALRRARIVGGRNFGVFALGNARASLAGVRVEGVREDMIEDELGGGIGVDLATLAVSGAILRDCVFAGLLVAGKQAVLGAIGIDVAAIGTSSAAKHYGVGAGSGLGGTLNLEAARIGDTHSAGVTVHDATAHLARIVVLAVQAASYDKPDGTTVTWADDIVVTGGQQTSVDQCLLLDAPRAGLLLDAGQGLHAAGNLATRNLFGLVRQAGVGGEILANAWFGNQTNVAAEGGTLDVPPSPAAAMDKP